jgi:hypothetical protein
MNNGKVPQPHGVKDDPVLENNTALPAPSKAAASTPAAAALYHSWRVTPMYVAPVIRARLPASMPSHMSPSGKRRLSPAQRKKEKERAEIADRTATFNATQLFLDRDRADLRQEAATLRERRLAVRPQLRVLDAEGACAFERPIDVVHAVTQLKKVLAAATEAAARCAAPISGGFAEVEVERKNRPWSGNASGADANPLAAYMGKFLEGISGLESTGRGAGVAATSEQRTRSDDAAGQAANGAVQITTMGSGGDRGDSSGCGMMGATYRTMSRTGPEPVRPPKREVEGAALDATAAIVVMGSPATASQGSRVSRRSHCPTSEQQLARVATLQQLNRARLWTRAWTQWRHNAHELKCRRTRHAACVEAVVALRLRATMQHWQQWARRHAVRAAAMRSLLAKSQQAHRQMRIVAWRAAAVYRATHRGLLAQMLERRFRIWMLTAQRRLYARAQGNAANSQAANFHERVASSAMNAVGDASAAACVPTPSLTRRQISDTLVHCLSMFADARSGGAMRALRSRRPAAQRGSPSVTVNCVPRGPNAFILLGDAGSGTSTSVAASPADTVPASPVADAVLSARVNGTPLPDALVISPGGGNSPGASRPATSFGGATPGATRPTSAAASSLDAATHRKRAVALDALVARRCPTQWLTAGARSLQLPLFMDDAAPARAAFFSALLPQWVARRGATPYHYHKAAAGSNGSGSPPTEGAHGGGVNSTQLTATGRPVEGAVFDNQIAVAMRAATADLGRGVPVRGGFLLCGDSEGSATAAAAAPPLGALAFVALLTPSTTTSAAQSVLAVGLRALTPRGAPAAE